MKTALFLLALAALASWASVTLDGMGAAGTVIEAAAPRERPEPVVETEPGDARASDRMAASGPRPPLFRAAVPPAALAAPEPGESFVLVGLAGEGERRVAFLRDEVDGRAFTVRAGEELRGWRVEAIEGRCVTLRQARRRQSACLQ